jgi:xylulokinase
VLNLYDGFARMPVSPREIRLTGGLSRSPAWCQTMADIFQAETVPVGGEGAALGAAIHAAWVWKKVEGEGRPLKEVADPFIVLDKERRARPRPGRPADLRSAAPPLPGPQPENPGAGRRGPLSLEAGVA